MPASSAPDMAAAPASSAAMGSLRSAKVTSAPLFAVANKPTAFSVVSKAATATAQTTGRSVAVDLVRDVNVLVFINPLTLHDM